MNFFIKYLREAFTFLSSSSSSASASRSSFLHKGKEKEKEQEKKEKEKEKDINIPWIQDTDTCYGPSEGVEHKYYYSELVNLLGLEISIAGKAASILGNERLAQLLFESLTIVFENDMESLSLSVAGELQPLLNYLIL